MLIAPRSLEFFQQLKRESRLKWRPSSANRLLCLTLRELLAPARLVEADLLTFDFARIARDEPRLR